MAHHPKPESERWYLGRGSKPHISLINSGLQRYHADFSGEELQGRVFLMPESWQEMGRKFFKVIHEHEIWKVLVLKVASRVPAFGRHFFYRNVFQLLQSFLNPRLSGVLTIFQKPNSTSVAHFAFFSSLSRLIWFSCIIPNWFWYRWKDCSLIPFSWHASMLVLTVR